MKTELNMLTSYIAMLVMTRPVYMGTDMLTTIKNETEQLKVRFHDSFNYATDNFKLAEIMNYRYTKLVGLANDLWERARLPNAIARVAMMEVLALKHFIECEYVDFLDDSRALTNFERFKLENHVLTELLTIKAQLRSKKIAETLVLQLEKVFLDLFKENRCAVFNALNKEYVDVLLAKLSALAVDKRDKNWNLRLRLLLIKFNCNHMGIYKLLESEYEHQILFVKDAEMQQDLLYNREIWIEQIQSYNKLAYNRDASDLKSMLLKQIRALGPHLAKKHKMKKVATPEKFKYKLSVDEIALAFHYYYEENVYGYLSKKAAAEAYCAQHQSIGTNDISVKSFLNFDKLEQHNAALKFYQRNSRIQKQLKADFDL